MEDTPMTQSSRRPATAETESLLRSPITWVGMASVVLVLAVGLARLDLIGWVWLGQSLAEGAAAAMCARAAQHGVGRARLTWGLFAAGLAIWCATDLLYGINSIVTGELSDGPNIFDVGWLAFYAPMLAGVALIYTALRSERGWQGFLDAALLAIAATVYGWVFLVVPALADGAGPSISVDLSYVSFDLLAIVAVGWLVLRLGSQSPTWLRLMIGAFGLQVAADLSFVLGGFLGSRMDVVSAAIYTAAGWVWALSARSRIQAPSRAWRAPARSAPPIWSQIVPAVLGVSLLLFQMFDTGPFVASLAFCGVVIMVVRFITAMLLQRTLIAERGELAELRTRLLAEESYAREVAEEAKRSLEVQNGELRRLDHMKDEFVAMVSHEFRTPITAIQNYLYSVITEEVGPLNDDQARFLGVVQRNTDRLSRLVEDVLLFARIQDGRMRLTPDEVDLRPLLADCVESARPQADKTGVRLILDGAPHVLGHWDPVRLGQVFDNLVSNAIKFTPEGGYVHVNLRGSADAAVIEIADTGPGISEDEIDKLFTPFFRTRHATDNAVPGTGLGLTISKSIVEAHDGAISVRAREGRGTVFRIALPIGSSVADGATHRQEVPA
jgi:signal transduction histidine kinase